MLIGHAFVEHLGFIKTGATIQCLEVHLVFGALDHAHALEWATLLATISF